MATEKDATAPDWFSIREAAAYLKVGEPTIYRWMREGRITYRKVGDSTRFLREDLEALVDVFPSTREATRATGFCPSCHHGVLLAGELRSTGIVHFQPARTRFWTLQDSRIPLQALICERCGSVVLRGDPGKLAALQATALTAAPPDPEPTNEE
jgi:excisionase family DNA binding protein